MADRKLRPTINEIPADLETPVTAFLKLRSAGARFLLESVEQGESIGRYSFIGLDGVVVSVAVVGAGTENPRSRKRTPLGSTRSQPSACRSSGAGGTEVMLRS